MLAVSSMERSLPLVQTLIDADAETAGRRHRLHEIAGIVPALNRPLPGCAFAPRCGFATPRCHAEKPGLRELAPAHRVACWEAHRVREAAA